MNKIKLTTGRARTSQAEVFAGSLSARVFSHRLQAGMVHVDAQRLRYQMGHHRLVVAHEFVRRQHPIELSIRPV